MPGVKIRTNLKDDNLSEDFEEKIVQKISETFEAPSELVYLAVSTGNRMVNNGNKSPMMFIDVTYIRRSTENPNEHYTKELIPFFANLLNLSDTRIVIRYHEANIYDFGMVRKAPEFKHAEYYCGLKP